MKEVDCDRKKTSCCRMFRHNWKSMSSNRMGVWVKINIVNPLVCSCLLGQFQKFTFVELSKRADM